MTDTDTSTAVQVDVLHVYHWPSNDEEGAPPATWSVDKADGSVVWHEDDNFGFSDLAYLAAEYDIDVWISRADKEYDGAFDDFDSMVQIVGYGTAPIAREDVQLSYHQGTRNQPMINVKVHNPTIPPLDGETPTLVTGRPSQSGGDTFNSMIDEHITDPRLLAMDRSELRDLVEKYIESHDWIFQTACESEFEQATTDAQELFANPRLKCWLGGRSGGWFIVDGLPDVESWGIDELTAWAELERLCKGLVDGIGYTMLDLTLLNCEADLAGRVKRVVLDFVLADADLDLNPSEWDWHGHLQLDPASTVAVRSAT